MNRWRSEFFQGLLWFSLANLLLCGFVFRDGLWGGSLLAPLDLAPACFRQYGFVDPRATGVIAGNAQFDQVFYDLPLQYGIYHSYRSGVIPWWDPYGFTGRPLLADAHINGTDPVRLTAYALLPFETAYNWTRVGHFILSGFTLFCLLAWWRFHPWICVLLALTFEFAGSHTFFFGFPWLHGSWLYYPLLWLAWDAGVRSGRWIWVAGAALAVAGIFYSGNLQSHAYIVLFAAVFAIGYGWGDLALWRRLVPMVMLSGALGACLAAPVLLNQLEFFHEGMRGVKSAVSSRVYLAGLASLTSIYPWALGDFRTIDVRSAFFQSIGFGQNYGLGFHTFIGSAGLVLAAFGALRQPGSDPERAMRRTGIGLVLAFLGVVSSPLISVFYTRSAGLFVLGGVVLMALATRTLWNDVQAHRNLGWCIAVAAIGIAVITHAGALVVYPRVLPRLEQAMAERDRAAAPGAIFKMPEAYRAFQLANFPNEVTFRNPEALFATFSLLTLAAGLVRPRWRASGLWRAGLLLLNLVPAVLFAARFVPKAPIALWERLREGGPEQRRAMDLVKPENLRLRETATTRDEYLFPDAIEHLYGVQTVHGYSALVPKTILGLQLAADPRYESLIADWSYAGGEFQRNPSSGKVQFQWIGPGVRAYEVDRVSLNEMRLRFGPGPAGVLLWTDTYYPGWMALADGRPVAVRREPPCFSKLELPADTRTLVLRYRPRYLSAGQTAALTGLVGIVLVAIFGRGPWLGRAQPCE